MIKTLFLGRAAFNFYLTSITLQKFLELDGTSHPKEKMLDLSILLKIGPQKKCFFTLSKLSGMLIIDMKISCLQLSNSSG